MSGHASVESLSSYIDREIGDRRRRALEGHLAECAGCRRRLRRLERVVERLDALRPHDPPAGLGHRIAGLAPARQTGPSPLGLLEQRVGRLSLRPGLLPIFAVVIALAAILFLFARGVERHQSRGPRMVVPPAAAPGRAAPEAGRTAAGRVFDRHGALWVERGLAEGLEPERPVRWIEVPSPEAARLTARHPELRELRELGGAVRLQVDGEVLELDFSEPAAPPAASPSAQR